MPSVPSQKDIDLLAKAWGICADTQPKVDYTKLAQICGYKTAASATTAYCNAKKRFFAAVAGCSPVKTVPQRTPKSDSKKRAAAEMGHQVEGESDDEENVKTPAVKKVKFKMTEGMGEGEEAKVKAESGDGEEGGMDLLKGLEEYAEPEGASTDATAAGASAAAATADVTDEDEGERS